MEMNPALVLCLIVVAIVGIVAAVRVNRRGTAAASGGSRSTVAGSSKPTAEQREAEEIARAQSRVGPGSIALAEQGIDRLARAIGNRAAENAALASIASDAGSVFGQEAMHALMFDPVVLKRTWYWLMAVAELAERTGKDLAVAKISSFVEVFGKAIAPSMGRGEVLEVGISGAAPGLVRLRISAAALKACARLDPETIVISDVTGSVSVAAVAHYAARSVLSAGAADQATIDPAILAQARAIAA